MAKAWDRLSPRETIRLQEARLREFVRSYLYPFSPFYRRMFDEAGVKPTDIRGLADLARLPLVSRSSFDANGDPSRPFQALLRPDERSLKRWVHRSLLRRVAREKLVRGDEAAERLLAEEFKPVHLHLPLAGGPVVGYTMRDLVAMAQAGARLMAVIGASRSDVLVSTLPYGPDLPAWFTYYAGQGAGMAGAHLGGGQAVRPSQAALWMGRLEATLLVAQPGYAEGLLRAAPPASFKSLRVLALWGGPGMMGARSRYAALLRSRGAPGAQVVTILGIPETRVAWGECPTPQGQPEASFGYHTYPDLELIEVVDPETGQPVDEAEPGEIVYTSLDWRGSGLLRYRTGLVARTGIVRSQCPGCGRTVPRIGADVSRLDWRARQVVTAGPTILDMADVAPILWGATGIPLWQIDVLRGGQGSADQLSALVTGADAAAIPEVQRQVLAYGLRTYLVPFQDLRRQMGVGLERMESRVVVRGAPATDRRSLPSLPWTPGPGGGPR